MDEKKRLEIEDTMRRYNVTREDLEMDLDTRENYPGEFYSMPLMQFGTEDLRRYMEATA